MKLTIHLQESKGTPRETIEMEIDAACLSDAAQKLPRLVLQHQGRLYGFHMMNPGHPAIFRERTVLCV